MKTICFILAFMHLLFALLIAPFKWALRKFSTAQLRPSRSVLVGGFSDRRRFSMLLDRLGLANLKRAGTAGAVAVVTMVSLFCPPTARAQGIGTYVTPRVYTLYSGVVTNGQTINIGSTLTNFLNYSGYHSIGLWSTVQGVTATNLYAPNGASTGTNAQYVLTWNDSPGIGNGYTNTVLGTNVVFSTNTVAANTWFQVFTSTNAAVTFTNIPVSGGDSIAWLGNFVLTTTTTNNQGFKFQLDAALTP